jgi:hypothetical protein
LADLFEKKKPENFAKCAKVVREPAVGVPLFEPAYRTSWVPPTNGTMS